MPDLRLCFLTLSQRLKTHWRVALILALFGVVIRGASDVGAESPDSVHPDMTASVGHPNAVRVDDGDFLASGVVARDTAGASENLENIELGKHRARSSIPHWPRGRRVYKDLARSLFYNRQIELSGLLQKECPVVRLSLFEMNGPCVALPFMLRFHAITAEKPSKMEETLRGSSPGVPGPPFLFKQMV